MKILPPNLAAVAAAADNTGGRYALNAVRLDVGEAEYKVEASDGKIGVRITGEYPAKSDEVSPPAGMNVTDEANTALIPADKWKEVFSVASKIKGLPRFRNVAVNIGKDDVQFGTLNPDSLGISHVRQFDGRFPDIDSCIPKKPPAVRIAFRADILAKLLKAVTGVFGKEAVLTFEILDSEKPAIVTTQSTEQKLFGLIMPVAGGKK